MFRRNRGGTLFSTAVALSGVCLSLGAVTLFYGRAINVQENNQRDLRIASLNARSGLEATVARMRDGGDIDLLDMIENASISTSAIDALVDKGCNLTAIETWRTPEGERNGFDARVMVVEAGSNLGGALRNWARVDSTGESNGRVRTLSTYIQPQVQTGGGANRLPLWEFGIATPRQLSLGQGPGWFELYAFHSEYDPFSYTSAWGRDWEDTNIYRREPGFTDAKIAALGQINLEGRIWGDVFTSFEYEHQGSVANALTEFGPHPLDQIGEDGLFTDVVWDDGANEELAALVLSDGAVISGNAEVTKGNIIIGDPGAATPNNGVSGNLHAALQSVIELHAPGQAGSVVDDDGRPAIMTMADGTEFEVSSALFNHALTEAQHVAYEHEAGSFDDNGDFTHGNFQLPPSIPVVNKAVMLAEAGALTEAELGYDPDLDIGYHSNWNTAPTLFAGAAPEKTSLHSWLVGRTAVIVKRGNKVPHSNPKRYYYKNVHGQVVGEGRYGWGHAVSFYPGQEPAAISYYQISQAYTSSSWRDAGNTGQQVRYFSVPTYCESSGTRRSGRSLRNVGSSAHSGSGAYIPSSGTCDYGDLIASPLGDGEYYFNSITMASSRSRWKIDLAQGDVTVYVNGDVLLDRGYFDVVNSSSGNEFKLIVGGLRGGDEALADSEEYAELAGSGLRMLDDSLCRVCINVDTDDAAFTLQAPEVVVNYNVSLASDNDINIWHSGPGYYGNNECNQYGNVTAGGDLFMASGGPARVASNGTVTAYGNINCEGRTCLVADGDARFELYPNSLGETGAGALTGVLQLSGKSVVDVGGDATIDGGSLWWSGSSPDFRVDGHLWAFLQDSYTMDYNGNLANLNHPAKIFVNLDNSASNLGPTGTKYVDNSYSGYHAESMFLEADSFRLCHCHDFWGGVFAPFSKSYVLHPLNWFGAAFVGYFDPGSELYEFHQDKALKQVASSTNEPDYSDVVHTIGTGNPGVVGENVLSFLTNTMVTLETSSRTPWTNTASYLSNTDSLLSYGGNWNQGKLSGWARSVPESFTVVGGQISYERLEDRRYTWACYVQNATLTGNLDALYTHRHHAEDHLGEIAVAPPSGGGVVDGGNNVVNFDMVPTNVVFDRSLNPRCPSED